MRHLVSLSLLLSTAIAAPVLAQAAVSVIRSAPSAQPIVDTIPAFDLLTGDDVNRRNGLNIGPLDVGTGYLDFFDLLRLLLCVSNPGGHKSCRDSDSQLFLFNHKYLCNPHCGRLEE